MANVMIMKEIEARALNSGISFDEFESSMIQLPPGQDFGIISDDEDVYEDDLLELDTDSGNIIVVDNLPVVPREKFEKLEGVIRKIYSQVGLIKKDGLWMPLDNETHKTLGHCFIEYSSAQEAELACERTNGYKLDKAHIFSVNLFSDFDRYMNVPEEWAPPQIKAYVPGENLQHWLTDDKARDQYVIRAGSDSEVFWNDARQLRPDLVYKRPYWTESYVIWSPLGSYLATIHKQGVALWGGASSFNQLMRYAHLQVKLVDFSPGEKYLMTYSGHEPSNPRDANRIIVTIFDVRTGKIMRDFRGSPDEFSIGAGGITSISWPIFRWGGGKDDKYFAKIGKNMISVYETETFGLLDKKSLKIENVVDFTWSPSDPILALFVPELGGGNQPARVSLMQIPSKQELRQNILFNVSDCKMYWQSDGEYLALMVDRLTKTKRSTHTGFDLFRVKEKDIPIEVLELDNKADKVAAFAWEPKGQRFAIIHGDAPRPDVSFYTMKTGRVSKLATLKGKQANTLSWSPAGHHVVLAGLKGVNGQLEFFNVDDLETMSTVEYFMATDLEWDPTGRYVATYVSSVNHEMENGFNIWSFNGKLLYRILKDEFYQFLWRPRPPSFLSSEKEQEIAKNLKKYSKKYEAEDQDVSFQMSEQDREKRRMLKEEWDAWVGKWDRLHEEEKMDRQKLRGGELSDDDDDDDEPVAKEVEVEELIDFTEEVLYA